LVGGSAFFLNWGITLYLLSAITESVIGIPNYYVAVLFGFIISGLYNYYLNRKFSFNYKEGLFQSLGKFWIVFGIGIIIALLISKLWFEVFHFPHIWLTPISSIIVLVWNFIGHKYYTFRN